MGRIASAFEAGADSDADARPCGRCESGTRMGLCRRILRCFCDLPIVGRSAVLKGVEGVGVWVSQRAGLAVLARVVNLLWETPITKCASIDGAYVMTVCHTSITLPLAVSDAPSVQDPRRELEESLVLMKA